MQGRVGPTAERRKAKRRQAATHKESPCGVAYFAALREIRPPRPHSSGRKPIGGHSPLGNPPSHFARRTLTFRVLREPGVGKRETGGFGLALRGRVAQIALTRFPPSHPLVEMCRTDSTPSTPPPTKNPLAAWRTSRLCVRSGRRDLTPVGANRSEGTARWATRLEGRTRNSKRPPSGCRFSRNPFSRSPSRTAKAQRRSSKCGERTRNSKPGTWPRPRSPA